MWRDFQVELREKYCKNVLNKAIREIGNFENPDDVQSAIDWSHQDRCWKVVLHLKGRFISFKVTQHHQPLLTKEIIDELLMKHSGELI